MKAFVLALVALVPAALPAQVTLSLEQYRKLVDAAEARPAPTPAPRPPVFRSADYVVDVAGEQAAITAHFQAEALDDSAVWIFIPDGGLIMESFSPPETILNRHEGTFAWSLSPRGRSTLDVRFLGEVESVRGGRRLNLTAAPALTASLRLNGIPEGWTAEVSSGLPTGERTWRLPPGGAVEIVLSPKATEAPKPVALVPMPPVIREATHRTRLVRDGTFLTGLEWTVVHDEPIKLRIRPGTGAQWVACKVGGRPLAPAETAPGVFEIPIAAETGPTKVELTYTGAGAAFAPVRGEFSIALPGTDLLAESIRWELTLPEDLEPVAVEGNCEFLPSTQRHVLHLRRELSRGDAPQVRVFYQKPETKKP